MGFIVGIVLVAFAVGLFIWGINCDDYDELHKLETGDFLTIEGIGNLVLILVAIIAIVVGYLINRFVVPVEGFSTLVLFFVIAAVLAKIGLHAIPLVMECVVFLLTGLEKVLPAAILETWGNNDAMLIISAIVCIALAIFVSVKTG